MMDQPRAYIGIDISKNHLPFTTCILDQGLKVVTLENFSLEEALSQALSCPSAVIAINAPTRPNKNLMKMAEVRRHLSPIPSAGHWTNLRLLDYELRRRGILAPRTPASSIDCPPWMQYGFTFYQRLQEGGFQAYPRDAATQQWFETQSEAIFRSLLGEALLDRDTLEGCLQRQMILFNQGVRIKDPMNFFEEVSAHHLMHGHLPLDLVHPLEELNALASAFTAWLAATRPEQVIRLGAADEGQAVLPSSPEFENAVQNLEAFHQNSFFEENNPQE